MSPTSITTKEEKEEAKVVTPEELKTWREDRNLSQAELAEMLAVDPMTVSRWERGKRTIPPFLHIALKWLSSKRNRKKLLDSR